MSCFLRGEGATSAGDQIPVGPILSCCSRDPCSCFSSLGSCPRPLPDTVPCPAPPIPPPSCSSTLIPHSLTPCLLPLSLLLVLRVAASSTSVPASSIFFLFYAERSVCRLFSARALDAAILADELPAQLELGPANQQHTLQRTAAHAAGTNTRVKKDGNGVKPTD